MTATIPERKWGWGQAPDNPSPPRVTIDAAWTPRQLSFALIRANWKRLAVESVLLLMHGISSMHMPPVVGRVVGDVAYTSYVGSCISIITDVTLFWYCIFTYML